AAISATVPKKQKLEHKFHHKHHHLPQHVHQSSHHQQHHHLGASSSASCTSAFASSTTNNFGHTRRTVTRQSRPTTQHEDVVYRFISADQSRLLCRSLRAHRLKGINGAEKLLLLLCNSRKQQQPEERDSNCTPFSRPPPLAGAVVADEVGQAGGQQQVQQQQRQQAVQVGAKKAKATTSTLLKVSSTSASLFEHCHRFSSDKSADELLELLVSDGKTVLDEQQTHFLVAELLDKRPDLLDVDASNFDAEVHALFSSSQPIVRSLIAHQLALCSSASVIKKTVSVLLKCFNPSLTPALVVSFVVGVCAEEAKIRLMLNGEQCFVLSLYVLEDIEHHYTPDMTETALASLQSMRQFCAVFDNLLSRATTTSTRTADVTGATGSLPVGTAQPPVVAVPYSPSSDMLDAFTRHYRTHVDKLWHASNVSAFSSSGSGQLRRRHCLNLLFRTVCRNFPVVPSKCLFLGMLAPRAGQQTPPHHIKRAQFDRLITGAIREIFELTSRAEAKGGPDVDLALDKAHQLVQYFRNSQDVQFSRYMPLLSTKVQNLVDSLAGCEIKNSPHCALLLFSLDLIIVALRNFDGTAAAGDNDYDNVDDDDGNNKNGTTVAQQQQQQQQPPLLHAVANALQSLLQFLKNRRNRQIQSLCEKVCNAVVQLLKSCGGDLTCNESARQTLRSNRVLLGELADWKALNLTDRAILKRTAMTAQFE
uniref:HECT domain-containing protein n=1 Tax=Globodera pallida TaxID=36090 RepID=A0A183CMQ0_GLOPA